MTFNFSRFNLPKQLFINNEYVDSYNRKKLTLYNPKDGSLIANDVALADDYDVDIAVAAAEQAFPEWKAMTAMNRRDIILKFADLMEKNIAALAELTRITHGGPIATFNKWETAQSCETFRYYATWIDKFSGESFPQDDGYMKVVRNEPLGVTAGIVPWNGPLGTIGLKAGPALAMGNCFILKPSEKTPFSSAALGTLIKDAGFPPGVFQILTGDGSTGAIISAHMKIRKVSFTGSIATGKKIQEAAARSNLKRVTLELGGKSPAVVFEDCNLENAINCTSSALTLNTGQVCFAATRVYVHEAIYEKFIEGYQNKLKESTSTTGDPEDTGMTVGPLVDEAQFKRVTGFIERGQQGQGRLILGGKRIGDKGFYIQPTIFCDVSPTAEIMREEIFGPVVIINTFKTEAEIIALSNDSIYGLMAGVFTQDINRALRVASAFDSGMVGINCISQMFTCVPFGGSKQSGLGRECGRESLFAWTERKTVMINLTY